MKPKKGRPTCDGGQGDAGSGPEQVAIPVEYRAVFQLLPEKNTRHWPPAFIMLGFSMTNVSAPPTPTSSQVMLVLRITVSRSAGLAAPEAAMRITEMPVWRPVVVESSR